MSEQVAYTVQYSCDFAKLEIKVPEVDLEHEDSIVLEVHERELVFTLPPYHLRYFKFCYQISLWIFQKNAFFRIPTEQDLKVTEVFPTNIDYEKGIIHYNIPLNKQTADDEKLIQTCHSYGFGDFYSGTLNIVCINRNNLR